MLESLPYEILSMITYWLPLASIRTLSQVSSKLHSVLICQIYRNVTFGARSEWALNVLDVDTFFRHHDVTSVTYLEHTRHLNIYASIHLARFNRCAFHNIFRATKALGGFPVLGTSNETKAHGQFLEDISDQLRQVFAHFKPNYLLSFRWRLGTCIPAGVLDRDGYLVHHQSRLTRLSLVTDGSCQNAGCHLDGLPDLSNLKVLEWEGLRHPAEVSSLKECIRRNQMHLTDLSVSFSITAAAPVFDSAILSLEEPPSTYLPGPGTVPFPFLSSLTLSRAALPQVLGPEFSTILSSLKTLRLRDCTNSFSVLECLSHLGGTVTLEIFEFCCENSVFDSGHQRLLKPMVDFLLSFKGLKHLYLRLSNFVDSSRIQAVFQHHRSTLESLAYHERQLTRLHDEGPWWDTRDCSPVWAMSLPKISNVHQLAALAFCTSPFILRTILEPGARTSGIRVLHFRLTGSEKLHRDLRTEIISEMTRENAHISCINDREQFCQPAAEENRLQTLSEVGEYVAFADWAFGPTGLPKLQLVAFGDFSYQERYSGQRFLARRETSEPVQRSIHTTNSVVGLSRSWNFCEADNTDLFFYNDWTRFLSVCPESGLMESPDDW